MGKIREIPRDIRYPYPKAVGEGFSVGKIIGRAMAMESFPGWGDYMRVLDLVEFQPDARQKRHRELRFCQFYRRAGGTDNDWVFGQGAGHMSVKTFYDLVRRAKERPDYGAFDRAFDGLRIPRGRKGR